MGAPLYGSPGGGPPLTWVGGTLRATNRYAGTAVMNDLLVVGGKESESEDKEMF